MLRLHLIYPDGSRLRLDYVSHSYVSLRGVWARRSPYLWRFRCGSLSGEETLRLKNLFEATPTSSESEPLNLAVPNIIVTFLIGDRTRERSWTLYTSDPSHLAHATREALYIALSRFPRRLGVDLNRHPVAKSLLLLPEAGSPDPEKVLLDS